MTDGQPPPGWWRASDGNFYPPEQLPAGWTVDEHGNTRKTPSSAIAPPVAPLDRLPLVPPLRIGSPGPSARSPEIGLGSTTAPTALRATRAPSRYKRWPLWARITAPVVAALALLTGIIALSGGNSNGPSKNLVNAPQPASTLAVAATTLVVTTTAPPSTTQATATPPSAAPTIPQPTTPPTTAPPATTATVRQGVKSGALCTPEGARGVTSTGAAMICNTTLADSSPRWRAA